MDSYVYVPSSESTASTPAASINDLPNETLHHIFLDCSGISSPTINSTHPRNPIIVCTHICSSWRTLITSGEASGAFWTDLRFFVPNTGRNAMRGPEGYMFKEGACVAREEAFLAHPVIVSVKEQLRRSQGRLVDVEVGLRERADVQYFWSLWATLEEARSRWRSLTLNGLYWNTRLDHPLFEPGYYHMRASKHDFPCLAHLKITLTHESSSASDGSLHSELQLWEKQRELPWIWSDHPDSWRDSFTARVSSISVACFSLPTLWSSPVLESVEMIVLPHTTPLNHERHLATNAQYSHDYANDEIWAPARAGLDPADVINPHNLTSLRYVKLSRVTDHQLATSIPSFRRCVEVLEVGMDFEFKLISSRSWPLEYSYGEPGNEMYFFEKLTRLRLLTSFIWLYDMIEVATAPRLTTFSVQRLTTQAEFDAVIGFVQRCNEARARERKGLGVGDVGEGINICVHGDFVDVGGARARLLEMGVRLRDSEWERREFGVERIVGFSTHDEY